MALLQESFNTTDGSTLGPDLAWTEVVAGVGVIGNAAYRDIAAGALTFAVADDTTGSTDHYVELLYSTGPIAAGGPTVRANTSNRACCFMALSGSATNTYRLYTVTSGGSLTQLGAAVNDPDALPDAPFTARLETEGTTLRGYINGRLVIERTSSHEASSTRAGFYTSGTAERIDSFEAGSDFITITTPKSPHLYCRNGSGEADVTIIFNYAGTVPDNLEARFNGGSWASIGATPAAGTGTGTLTAQVTGQGTLEVRDTVLTNVKKSVFNVAIGPVYVLGGQSNASGRLTNLQSYSNASFDAFMFTESLTQWQYLEDPTDPETALGSPWPLLATLLMADLSMPVGFITVADGGTALVDEEWDSDLPGSSYSDALAVITASGVDNVTAYLFDQGEEDAGIGNNAGEYYDHLIAFAADIQSDTGFTAPVIVAQTGQYSTATQYDIDAIRMMQAKAWATSDIEPGPLSYDRAGTHWETDPEGATIASRWWAAIDNAVYGGANGRGPRIISATYVGDRILLTYDRDLDETISSYTASAFTVDNPGGSALTVSSAARRGKRRVVLALSGAITSETPTLSFASDQDGSEATVPATPAIALPATINSVSTVKLPAEPTIDLLIIAKNNQPFESLAFGGAD